MFFAKYPVDINDALVIKEHFRHTEFARSINLSYTPFVLLNGYELPENYIIEDLTHLLFLKS